MLKLFSTFVYATSGINRYKTMPILQIQNRFNGPIRHILATQGTNVETKDATSITELDTAVLLK